MTAAMRHRLESEDIDQKMITGQRRNMRLSNMCGWLWLLVAVSSTACGSDCVPPPESAHHITQHTNHKAAPGPRPTETFRAHHVEIRNKLDEAGTSAMALSATPPAEVGKRIQDIVHFFQHELIPHAEAEERVLYSVADRLVPTEGGRRYTDSLRYEHTVVAREIQALHDAMERSDHSPVAIAALQRRVLELVGLVKAHFGAEEDVILAVFDEMMSAEEFQREVVEPMGETGARSGGTMPEHDHKQDGAHPH
jgi:hemerythrin-like domain-containing protein